MQGLPFLKACLRLLKHASMLDGGTAVSQGVPSAAEAMPDGGTVQAPGRLVDLGKQIVLMRRTRARGG